MSNRIWAVLQVSSPCRMEINGTEQIATNHSNIKTFVDKSVLESSWKRFHNSWKLYIFNLMSNKIKLDWPAQGCKKNFFPWFMSDQHLSTRSQTRKHLGNFLFYLPFSTFPTSQTSRCFNGLHNYVTKDK